MFLPDRAVRLLRSLVPLPNGVLLVTDSTTEGPLPSPAGSNSEESEFDRPPPSLEALEESLKVIEQIGADPAALAALPHETLLKLRRACGRISHPEGRQRRAVSRAKRRRRELKRRRHDEEILERTGIRRMRASLIYPTPQPEDGISKLSDSQRSAPPIAWEAGHSTRLQEARNCYICKADYREVHAFYDSLCQECAEFNWAKRFQTADLSGRVAYLSGGRVKIGYQTGIKLLRAGAKLIVSTRFPRDAAKRYEGEADFEEWNDRLNIYGLDLRHTPSVEAFAAHILRTESRLDYLINNACQTVRRPPGFYDHLMAAETESWAELDARLRPLLAAHRELTEHSAIENDDDRDVRSISTDLRVSKQAGIELSAALSQLVLVDGDSDRSEDLFPREELDADLQQVDLRTKNSWRLPLDEVPTVELLEVHLTNAVAPFVLNARLKPLMMRPGTRDQHVVNVSAVEGQFYRSFKTDKHPHTNMAKAALNMMTRTSAPDYFADGIHMNSVDTGWITDEDPVTIQKRKTEEHGFHPPLDHVDAAARILDPIVDGVTTGSHVWGQFLKDYRPTPW